ncbi:MAG TPA: hypothetical protein VEY30_11815 [Myxococcaceae bacterium]|nr:hypothetical protein [Myxococcaceae bacterium]
MKSRIGWVVLTLGLGWVLGSCGEDSLVPDPGGTEELPGTEADGGIGGEPDAGPDPIPDAGTPDGGPGPQEPGFPLPNLPNWQFYGRAQGGPRQVFGVSSDQAGNIWVAGGDDGLFLLPLGAQTFRRFTIADGLTPYRAPAGDKQQPVLSVAGAQAGVVFVGYKGVHAGREEQDPPYMVKSGDVDRVTLSGGVIQVQHLDIFSPTGEVKGYNENREKIRDVYRIVYNPVTGDAWFGGNHGVALYNGLATNEAELVLEHVHADINGYATENTATGLTILSDLWKGVAITSTGTVWTAGAHRTASIAFGTNGRNFQQFTQSRAQFIDLWPDAKPENAKPSERTDDFVEDLALTSDGGFWAGSLLGLAFWQPGVPISYVPKGVMVDEKVTSLELDAQGSSLWIGHIFSGLSRRLPNGQFQRFDFSVFGNDLVRGNVPDIQSDVVNGQRRILVAFGAGAIGIYTGP